MRKRYLSNLSQVVLSKPCSQDSATAMRALDQQTRLRCLEVLCSTPRTPAWYKE